MTDEKTTVTAVIVVISGLGFACVLVPWLDDLILTVMILAAVVGLAVSVVAWCQATRPTHVHTTGDRTRDTRVRDEVSEVTR